MTEEDWDNMDVEKQMEIMQKCKGSPAYFYNNFWKKEGMPDITDEQILEMRRQAMMPLKLRGSMVRQYPIIPDYLKK